MELTASRWWCGRRQARRPSGTVSIQSEGLELLQMKLRSSPNHLQRPASSLVDGTLAFRAILEECCTGIGDVYGTLGGIRCTVERNTDA